MFRFVCCATVCATIAWLTGCDTPIGPASTAAASSTPPAEKGGAAVSGGVAVIDLDEVARRLGDDVQIIEDVKRRETRLNDELQTLQVSYTRQLEDKQREFGYSANEEQQKELQQLDMSLGTKLQQAQLDAQRELAMLQNSLVQRLRERVRPVARDVAKSRGLSTIVVKNLDVLFYHDEAHDITNEVVEKLLAQGGATFQSPSPAYPREGASPASEPPREFPYTAEQPGQASERR